MLQMMQQQYQQEQQHQQAQCAWIFIENVSHIRGLPGVWRPLFRALGSQGFTV